MIIEKKNFSIDEVEKECFYLESKEDYILESYDGEKYTFKNASGRKDYAIHFTIEPLVDETFKKFGYSYLFTYEGSRGGYYHYLVREHSEGERYRDYGDRIEAIGLLESRLSRFTFTVVTGLLMLFAYLFIKNKQIVYLLVLIPGGILGIYSLILRDRYKKFKEKYKID